MAKKIKGIVRVGTSGLVVPGTISTFPEEFQSGTRLQYYGTLFNTIEINSSFYKVPMGKTLEKWTTEVPDNFNFTLKLWREITHAKSLNFEEKNIEFFMNAANRLGIKKGCLLIQFPGSINFNYFNEVEKLLSLLSSYNTDKTWIYVVELRHNSWYQKLTYEMLNKNAASMVIQDIPKSKTPMDHPANKTIYLRFHGPSGNYRETYENEFLEDLSEKIKDWQKEGKNVYAYFNNTMGNAYENAQYLKMLCTK